MAEGEQSEKHDTGGMKDDTAPDATTGSFAERVQEATGAKAAAADAPVESPSPAPERASRLAEPPPTVIDLPADRLKAMTRRDFLLFGAGAVAAGATFWWLLPSETQHRLLPDSLKARLDTLEMRSATLPAGSAGVPASVRAYRAANSSRDRLLGKVLTFDDDVAEALYSPERAVPTYSRLQAVRDLRNNYNGATPDDYVDDWTLTVTGLASGKAAVLRFADLARFGHRDQVTRLVCVEGWSAVTWWGGFRYADFLAAYPPAPGARWAHLTSSLNLDADGNSDPYYVSIDLATARHPQTLLATHHNGAPLNVDHGAPLRLIVPMKLGLKNIKAITNIDYVAAEPSDYWNERGYSRYDGI